MQSEGVDHTRLSGLQVGAVLDGRYEIVEVIGSGAMGTVVRVVDRALKNTHVVLKFLRSELLADKKQFERFRNEALMMRELSHPNIVRVFDFGVLGGDLHYISMEYIDGKSLRRYMEESGEEGLAFGDVLQILFDVAQGMAHAHERNVVHRDLKPDNVLIDRFEEVKITDFGLAKSLLFHENLTAPGETVGTPHYMSPEQLKGLPLDPRCDIYSFGIMAFELAAGYKPFAEDNYLKLATMHLDEPLPPLPKDRDIPGWFNHFVIQCTQKDPDARFQSFDEVLGIIGSFVKHKAPRRATGSIPRGSLQRRWLWMLRWQLNRIWASTPILCGLSAAMVLALVLGLGRLHPPIAAAYAVGLIKAERVCGCALPSVKSALLGPAAADYGYEPELLYSAVRDGKAQAAELLIAGGVPPTYLDRSGRSALHLAVRQGNAALVRSLSRLAPPQLLAAEDPSGKTLLMEAIAADNYEIVEALLKAGASPLHKDREGNTCLIRAAAGSSIGVVELLLAHGAAAQINERNARGKTALQAAVTRRNSAIIKLLTDSGAVGR